MGGLESRLMLQDKNTDNIIKHKPRHKSKTSRNKLSRCVKMYK